MRADKINFTKFHGAGNDFVIIDNTKEHYYVLHSSSGFPLELIRTICNRNFGVGADGLIVLEKAYEGFAFYMRYYNSDGRNSSLCGNGSRCAVKFAFEEKLIAHRNVDFDAYDGPHEATVLDNGEVRVKFNQIPITNIVEHPNAIEIDSGSPHYIIVVQDIGKLNLIESAHSVRYNLKYKESGINVNFVQKIDEGKFKIRTYERGVEGETLSCGTGVVASAVAMHYLKYTHEKSIEFEAVGGDLRVDFLPTPAFYTEVYLQGGAKRVFQGTMKC